MLLERFAAFDVGSTGIEIISPIAPHPRLDQRAVRRLLPAEHQVDLQCLVDKSWIGSRDLELFFQAKDQPRAEQPFECNAIFVLGRRLQSLALAEAKPGSASDCN